MPGVEWTVDVAVAMNNQLRTALLPLSGTGALRVLGVLCVMHCAVGHALCCGVLRRFRLAGILGVCSVLSVLRWKLLHQLADFTLPHLVLTA